MSNRDQDSGSDAPVGIWRPLNRFLFALIVVAVATIAGYRFLPEFMERDKQERQLEMLQAQIDHAQQTYAKHQLEEALLKEDPEFIGTRARDLLDLRKPGEYIYRLEPAPADLTKMRRRE